jgi:hypothetical protein
MQLNRMTTDELFIEAKNSLSTLARNEDTLIYSEIMEIMEELAKREAWTYHDFISDALDNLGALEDEDYSEES